jgi:hypothetical protein
MPYRSILGKRVGVAGDQLLVNGRAVGGSMPTGVGQGKTWYVSSVINAGNGETVDGAAGTLQEVIDFLDLNSANDNRGDTIVILPNHAETITGVGGLTFDVPGLTVVGMGVRDQRPRFLMDGGTTVTAVVSAADVTIKNCVFAAGHKDVATCFDLDAKGFTLVDCEFIDNTTHECFLICVTSGSATDNVCDGLTLIGNKAYTATDAGFKFVSLVGDTDWLHVEGNWFSQGKPGGSVGAAGIFLDGTAGDDWGACLVKNNYINCYMTATDVYPLGGGNDQTDNTGMMADNYVATRQSVGTSGAASQQLFTKGTGFNFAQCWHLGKVNQPFKRMPIATDEAGWY